MRRAHLFHGTLCCLLLTVSACKETTSSVDVGTPGVKVVSGLNSVDTVATSLKAPLVIEVRDREGKLASQAVVRFTARIPTQTPQSRRGERSIELCPASIQKCTEENSNVEFVVDTTDASGRAAVSLYFASLSGAAAVEITVPELGTIDSARFVVNAGNATRVRAVVADSALNIGDTTSIRGVSYDRYSNVRTEPAVLSSGVGDAFSLSATGGIATGTAMGTRYVVARLGVISDSTPIVVIPTGRLVMWAGDDRLMLVNIDGTNSRTMASNLFASWGPAPRWDASRQRVVARIDDASPRGLNGGPTALAVVDTLGTYRRDIVATVIGSLQIYSQRLMPDESILVHGLRLPTFFYRIAPDNSITTPTTVPDPSEGSANSDISPDGTKIAYVSYSTSSNNELRVRTLATGAQIVVAQHAVAPRWSRQSDRLVYLIPPSVEALSGVPVVVSADGTGTRQLGTYVLNAGLSWSPDATYIIGTMSPSFNVFRLRLMRVSDGLSLLVGDSGTPGNPVSFRQPDWR